MNFLEEPTQHERAIDLGEFVASTRRHPALNEFHCVFVDENNQVVAAYRDLTPAIEAFFDRLDTNPVATLRLRIYTVDPDELALHWPDGRSPLERARRLLGSDTPVDLGAVSVAFFHEHLLGADPGELQIGGRTRRMFELWWPNPTGQREIIGRAIEGDHDPGSGLTPWGLWTVHGTRETDPGVIERRLAKTINTLLPTDWKMDWQMIRRYRTYQRGRLPFDPRFYLIELATRIAEQFGLLDPDGEELN